MGKKGRTLPKIVLYILLLFIMSGCVFFQKDLEEDTSLSSEQNVVDYESQHLDESIEVIGWYNDSTLLSVEEQNGTTLIKRFDLHNQQQILFYETNKLFASYLSNEAASLFAFEFMDEKTNQMDLIVLNQMGEIVFEWIAFAEHYQVFFHPETDEEMGVRAFMPGWTFTNYLIHLPTDTMQELPVDEITLNWFSRDRLAYLQSKTEQEFSSSLFTYSVDTGEKQLMFEDVIMYQYLGDGLRLIVDAESLEADTTNYRFYDGKKEVANLEMPTLHTLTTEWWLPQFEFNSEKGLFYVYRPQESADFFSYEEEFDLIEFEIRTGEYKVLSKETDAFPFQAAPDFSVLLQHKPQIDFIRLGAYQ